MDTKKILRAILRIAMRPAYRMRAKRKIAQDLENTDPAVRLMAWRLEYALNAALAHANNLVAWRAVPQGRELPRGDRDWCTTVCESTINKRARPPHPDSDIEEFLQNVTAS
jgi:hypothetical protein